MARARRVFDHLQSRTAVRGTLARQAMYNDVGGVNLKAANQMWLLMTSIVARSADSHEVPLSGMVWIDDVAL